MLRKWILVVMMGLVVQSQEEQNRLSGYDFLVGIQDIIGSDPTLPRDQIGTKPFSGSFSSIQSTADSHFESTSYCLTDKACGHWEAYSRPDVPLTLLDCNTFCFIDENTRRYRESQDYTVHHPPRSFLNCGWETCA